jgi:hypothetical protein
MLNLFACRNLHVESKNRKKYLDKSSEFFD